MLLSCEIILVAISEIFIIWLNWIGNVGSVMTDDFLFLYSPEITCHEDILLYISDLDFLDFIYSIYSIQLLYIT